MTNMNVTDAIYQQNKGESESGALGSILEWAGNNPPQWDKYKLAAWDIDQLEKVMPFVESHYWSDRESVNVFNVIGTVHPDYIGLSWREFLHQGKRMPVNQDLLQSNPIYYSETQVKQPSMLYISLDGKSWYINGDGNHRTCLARFHFARMNALGRTSEALVHGVTVDDYRVNWRLFDAYQNLQASLLKSKRNHGQIAIKRENFARRDGPGWKLDSYRTQLIFNSNSGEEISLTYEEATELAYLIKNNPVKFFKRWLKR
ncbi:MAG: hypothetical protein ABL885_06115 [Methylophilaceae bacterium]